MGYQFFLPTEVFDEFVEKVCKGIPKYGKELDAYLRFEVGQPIQAIYQQENYSLYELGYSWNLDFTKEEFKGRENLLESINATNFKSIGFKTDKSVAAGTQVIFDNEIVGKVCWSADQCNSLNNYLGLMIIDKEYAHAGVTFVTENGELLQTISSPYKIPESWTKE